MIGFTILGVIVAIFFAIIVIGSMPWGQWWCAISRGHNFQKTSCGFWKFTWTADICTHCGKTKK
jgi:hypothetical protein